MCKAAKTLELRNGVQIPVLGFGTWQVADGQPVYDAVTTALECGYTHIDTASAYYNEAGIGKAIDDSGLSRDGLFITTKLWNTEQGYESTLESFARSMERLRLDYLDLFLVHWPVTYIFQDQYPQKMLDTWKAFEELYRGKKIRAIGVSNFLGHHIDKLMEHSEILPMVNQLEIHPGYNQRGIVAYCRERGIIVEPWSPLASGRMFNYDSPIPGMTRKYGKTAAQIALRWHLQNGWVPLPKSTTPSRIAENFDVFDFELDDADMKAIDDMPESGFSGYHPDDVGFLENLG